MTSVGLDDGAGVEARLASPTGVIPDGGLTRRRGTRIAGWAFSAVAALSLLILVVYPLAAILIQSVVPDLFGAPSRLTPSLAAFGRAFASREIFGAMLNTTWLGALVAVLGTVLGAGLAVLLRRTDLPGRRVFDALVWVTLFTPSYLVALAWELLFTRGGFIDVTIAPLPDGVITTIFSPAGLATLLALRLFPFSYLAVGAALRGLGSEYEEAARMVGARPLRRWLRINLPLLAPALCAGGLIIFAEAISDYGTAATIAQQAGFNLVTYELYAAINNSPVDFALSAALSCLLVLAIAAALLLQTRVLRARSYQIITGRTRRVRPAALGRWRLPLLALVTLLFVGALLLPLVAAVGFSFMRNEANGWTPDNIVLSNYQAVLDTSGDMLAGLARSTLLAILTATIAAFLGAAVAFVVERTRVAGRAFLQLTTIVTLAIPGVVLAAGYIFAWNQPWMNTAFGGTPYGTLALLLAAYVAGALPFSARLAGGALAQVGDHLLEAGRLSGASTLRIFTHIILPVVAPALLSTWILVFTGTIFELPASELLQPPGQPPLAVEIVNQFNNFKQGPGTAMTIMALVVVALAVLAINTVSWLLGRHGGREQRVYRGL